MVNQFPFGSDFVLLRDAMNQTLQDSFATSGGGRWPSPRSGVRPLALDVCGTPDEVTVIVAVPGMTPDDLEISCTQNTLTLSGRVPPAVKSEQGTSATWYMRELWHGQFRRSITLPYEVDASQAEAAFEHGMVRITLARAEWTKPQKIAITAGSAQREAIGTGSGS